MSHSPIELAPGRYRESFGRHYEDFVVGDVYEHRPGRTLTEAEVEEAHGRVRQSLERQFAAELRS